MKLTLAIIAGVALAVVAPARPARAGTDTDTLSVTATVQSSCSLNGGTLSFGQYISGQQTDLDVTGTINFVNCSGELTFELDGGSSGNVAARQMRSGSNRLSYQIYRNQSRTAVWGLNGDAHGAVLLTPQSGSLQVYGRIPRGQGVPDGLYTDLVNITLNF